MDLRDNFTEIYNELLRLPNYAYWTPRRSFVQFYNQELEDLEQTMIYDDPLGFLSRSELVIELAKAWVIDKYHRSHKIRRIALPFLDPEDLWMASSTRTGLKDSEPEQDLTNGQAIVKRLKARYREGRRRSPERK